MQWLQFFIAILPFLVKVYDEIISQAAQAKLENKKFVLDQATLQAAVHKILESERAATPGQSAGAGNAWDASDKPRQ